MHTFQEADRERRSETGEDSSESSDSEQFATPGKEGRGAIAAVQGSGIRRGRPTNLERLSTDHKIRDLGNFLTGGSR